MRSRRFNVFKEKKNKYGDFSEMWARAINKREKETRRILSSDVSVIIIVYIYL